MNDLPMYIVYNGDHTEGALLAFARTGQQARVIGHRSLGAWLADAEFHRCPGAAPAGR